MKTSGAIPRRYELKFIIPVDLIDPITEYISPYCGLDYYSKKENSGYYQINSLYFDTDNYLFLKRKILDISERFNIRIRSYGPVSKPPYFFEVKHRNSFFVFKKRAKIARTNWHQLFDTNSKHFILNNKEIAGSDLRNFLMNLYLYNAAPKILISYKRLAFVSKINNYARATFDKDLCFKLENDYVINPRESDMIFFGGVYPTELNNKIILELKSKNSVPAWMMDLIRRFDLNRGSFSKYTSGMQEAFNYNPYKNNIFEIKSNFL